jgi:hypothetical protein
MSERKDFDTADEPDLGQDDDKPSRHLTHKLHRIRHRLEEIVSSLRHAIEHRDHRQMELDFTSFDAAVAELGVVTASLNATISGDVSTAVAAQAATDQTAQDAAVAKAIADTQAADKADAQTQLETKVSGLQAEIDAFKAAAAANSGNTTGGNVTVPTPITISPTSLAAGTPLSGSFAATGGTGNLTFTPATSSNADVSVDATGAYTGTGIPGETLDVTVTDEASVSETTIVSIT